MLPEQSMTYADIRLEVAKRSQKLVQDTDSGRMIADPTEPAYSRITDAIRAGCREFWRAHNWSFLTSFVEVQLNPDGTGPLNIDGDASRYLLPDVVQSYPKGWALYRGPDDEPGGHVKTRHMDEVAQRLFMEPTATGTPESCATEWNASLRPKASQRGGIELRVFPKPDQAYRLGFRAKVGVLHFTDPEQRGQWPTVHDQTVVDFAVAELFKSDRAASDPERAGAVAAAQSSLAVSIARDTEDYQPGEIGGPDEMQWPRGRLVTAWEYTTDTEILRLTVYG